MGLGGPGPVQHQQGLAAGPDPGLHSGGRVRPEIHHGDTGPREVGQGGSRGVVTAVSGDQRDVVPVLGGQQRGQPGPSRAQGRRSD